MSAADPWGRKLPPKLTPKINAISNGIEENPVPTKICITGIKRTVTGKLSRNPERMEFITSIKTHSKKRLFGVIFMIKSSSIRIIPTFSKQNINTNKLTKKNTSLKSTFFR